MRFLWRYSSVIPTVVVVLHICTLIVVAITAVRKKQARKFMDLEAAAPADDSEPEMYSSDTNDDKVSSNTDSKRLSC